jgi:hypothetical protein
MYLARLYARLPPTTWPPSTVLGAHAYVVGEWLDIDRVADCGGLGREIVSVGEMLAWWQARRARLANTHEEELAKAARRVGGRLGVFICVMRHMSVSDEWLMERLNPMTAYLLAVDARAVPPPVDHDELDRSVDRVSKRLSRALGGPLGRALRFFEEHLRAGPYEPWRTDPRADVDEASRRWRGGYVVDHSIVVRVDKVRI